MAERYRSNDMSRDTDEYLEGAEATPVSFQGRQGGDIARETATRAELARAEGRPEARATLTKEQSQLTEEDD